MKRIGTAIDRRQQAPRLVRNAESPLAWLRRRKDRHGQPLITEAQFEAGERLRADLWRAQMTPRVTADWSRRAPGTRERRSAPGAGVEMADTVVAAKQRVHKALCAVGGDFAGLLIDVCGHLKGLEQLERSEGWPQRSAKVYLRYALNRLALHYGFIRVADENAAIRNRLRHWGAEDYRPNLDSWKEPAA